MNSLWLDSIKLPSFPRLERDMKTDVLVIGGGMAGVLCAYMLAQNGIDYILVEADRICQGITGSTTAKITSQHGLIYDKLISRFGVEKARMYLEANEVALACYRHICSKIPCDFEEKSSYVYSLESSVKLERELKALEKTGFRAELVNDLPLPFSAEGAIRFDHQAQFHPLKFIAGIVQGLNIYENTTVCSYDGSCFITDRAKIKTQQTIVTTHFPFINKHGSYFLKLYQNRSYVLALKKAAEVDGMYVDERDEGMSFRNYGDMLLLGGGAHRTGKHGGNWQELAEFAQKHYPDAKEQYRWATQDCMTLDRIPYIGQYSKQTPNFYVATGFNKWGMTSSMAAAMILCDMVQGKEHQYAPVFSPSRTMLRPQLMFNAFETTASLLTFTKPRCPHMGCALKWNAQEHSWDCPCHGSRFTKTGKLLENPSTDDIELHS